MEEVVVIEDVEIGNGLLVGDAVVTAACDHLVENRQRIAHSSVRFLSYDV